MTVLPHQPLETQARFLEGGGDMGRRIRDHNWALTTLGPPVEWPPTLQMAIRLLLTTGHPVFVFWGEQHVCFYNDAYARSLGAEKHPRVLGLPGHEAWTEIWDVIGPQIRQVMSGGAATWHENQLVPILRHGQLEDVYWTYSFGPIDDASYPAGVGGVLVLCTETTQAVLAARRLEAAEARWRSLFDQAPGFVTILQGPAHRFEFANPRYLELVGGRPLLGKTVAEAVPEAAGQGFVELLDAVYSEGRARTGRAMPLSLRDPADGTLKLAYVDFVYEPIFDAFGVVTGIFVLGFDSSDQVRTHLELAQSEERYRALAEHLPGGAVFVVDRELRYTMAAGEALADLGLSPADFVGSEVANVASTSGHVERFQQALAGHRFEDQHSESGRHFLTRGVPLLDGGGTVSGALAVSFDVTERHAAQAELEKAKAKLEGVLASAEVGIWTWDMRTDQIEQDANVARLYGLPAKPVASVAEHWGRILPEDHPIVEAAIAGAVESGVFTLREFRVRREDNGVRWLAGRGRVTRDEAGQPQSLSGLVIDIDELKKLEHSLREADQQKDEFLAMLAHELRNPLAALGNVGEILERLKTTDSRLKLASGVLRRQLKLLTRLVDDLLDVSRITQKKITLIKTDLILSDIVAQAVETVAPIFQEKRHRLSVTASAVIHVVGDQSRLVQCMVNVLSNAAKYTEPGGHIEVETLVQGSEACLQVRDNGVGIPADLLPHVFDLFVQSTRTLDRSQGGLGIGLSVVKRLIEMHDGRVTAFSEGVGRGTCVTVCLPLAQQRNEPPKVAAEPTLQPLTILIVDDNADVAELLRFILEIEGHDVKAANSSNEALAKILNSPPQVALLDIGMPGLDGFELAARIRGSMAAPNIRLIAMTGYGQETDRERARLAGFDDFLVKPVEHATLLASLARLTRQ